MAKHVVVSLSGGMDSSTLLLRAINEYDTVTGISCVTNRQTVRNFFQKGFHLIVLLLAPSTSFFIFCLWSSLDHNPLLLFVFVFDFTFVSVSALFHVKIKLHSIRALYLSTRKWVTKIIPRFFFHFHLSERLYF